MAVRNGQGRPDFCLSLAAIESHMQADRLPFLVDLQRAEVGLLEARLKEFEMAGKTRPATDATNPMRAVARRR